MQPRAGVNGAAVERSGLLTPASCIMREELQEGGAECES